MCIRDRFNTIPIYYPEKIHFIENSYVCTINNTAYIMTNQDISTGGHTNYTQSIYIFTPTTNHFKKINFKEENAIYSTIFSLQEKIYVGLGNNTISGSKIYHNTFHVYDPKTKIWTKCKNEFPEKRKVTMIDSHTKTFTINNKVYLLCEDKNGKILFYEASIR